jgi:hypothetical protein
MKCAAMIGLLLIAKGSAAFAQIEPNDTSLRAADATQMRIIVEEDARAQQDFMHPDYIINAPSNRVLKKAQVVAMLAKGMMASEQFERTIEATSITGNVGIVMGRETVIPSANSQLGTQLGVKTLNRRFTNVFMWEGGRWRFLARQASVVVAP